MYDAEWNAGDASCFGSKPASRPEKGSHGEPGEFNPTVAQLRGDLVT